MVYTDDENVRNFAAEVDELDLVWHRDLEDRTLHVDGTTDWLIQLEDELPQEIDGTVVLAKTWHRLIKGSGELNVRIN